MTYEELKKEEEETSNHHNNNVKDEDNDTDREKDGDSAQSISERSMRLREVRSKEVYNRRRKKPDNISNTEWEKMRKREKRELT